MATKSLVVPCALALLVPLTGLIAPGTPIASAQQTPSGEAEAIQGEDWSLQARVLPDEGLRLTSQGTVDDRPATLERRFDADEARLTVSYTLGPEAEPDRHVEASLDLLGVYVFDDVDGDERFSWQDEILDHEPLDASRTTVSPVRTQRPLQAVQASLPLAEDGQIVLTLTGSEELAMVEGNQLAPTQTWLNLTVADVPAEQGAHVGLAVRLQADGLRPLGSEDRDRIVQLDGDGAAIQLLHAQANLAADRDTPTRSSLLETQSTAQAGTEGALVLATPGSGVLSHGTRLSAVHTAGALEDTAEAIRGQPGAFALGLLAATLLVGAGAWRKLHPDG